MTFGSSDHEPGSYLGRKEGGRAGGREGSMGSERSAVLLLTIGLLVENRSARSVRGRASDVPQLEEVARRGVQRTTIVMNLRTQFLYRWLNL